MRGCSLAFRDLRLGFRKKGPGCRVLITDFVGRHQKDKSK